MNVQCTDGYKCALLSGVETRVKLVYGYERKLRLHLSPIFGKRKHLISSKLT